MLTKVVADGAAHPKPEDVADDVTAEDTGRGEAVVATGAVPKELEDAADDVLTAGVPARVVRDESHALGRGSSGGTAWRGRAAACGTAGT